MRALCWNGINDLRVETVLDPQIVTPHNVILRVTMSTTCGSDLHFIDGYIPTMCAGDIISTFHRLCLRLDEAFQSSAPDRKHARQHFLFLYASWFLLQRVPLFRSFAYKYFLHPKR